MLQGEGNNFFGRCFVYNCRPYINMKEEYFEHQLTHSKDNFVLDH